MAKLLLAKNQPKIIRGLSMETFHSLRESKYLQPLRLLSRYCIVVCALWLGIIGLPWNLPFILWTGASVRTSTVNGEDKKVPNFGSPLDLLFSLSWAFGVPLNACAYLLMLQQTAPHDSIFRVHAQWPGDDNLIDSSFFSSLFFSSSNCPIYSELDTSPGRLGRVGLLLRHVCQR
jgi:hypothetical protein